MVCACKICLFLSGVIALQIAVCLPDCLADEQGGYLKGKVEQILERQPPQGHVAPSDDPFGSGGDSADPFAPAAYSPQDSRLGAGGSSPAMLPRTASTKPGSVS